MMKKQHHRFLHRSGPQSGNIFFMLIGAVALIGAMTVAGGNTVRGIVTSMSEVTRKTVAEEKMQSAARLAIQSAVNCDTDTPSDFTEPVAFRDPGTSPHPVGGGLLPETIGATLRDPWGTEYGYCAWNLGNGVCADSPNRLAGGDNPANTVVAVVSAGKDRVFSSTCGNTGGGGTYTPAAGVVARWTLDEAAGTQAADSINGHDGTYSGGAVPTTAGVVGTAFQFDGTNYVTVPNSPDLNLPQYTVAAWVRGDSAPTTGAREKIVSGHINYGIFWSHNSDPVSCEHMQDVSYIWAQTPSPALTFNAGEWYHLACTYDGATLRMYVNGTLASSVAATAPEINVGEPLAIGIYEHTGVYSDGFSGAVDDVLLFDRALSDGEVSDIYSGGSSPGVIRDAASDDIIFEYTYNDAIGLGGDDLWRIIDTRPGTAGIDRNIDVAGGAELAGPLNLMRSGLILPGDDVTGPCVLATDQQLRINFSMNPAVLEICDFAGGNDWIAVSMADGGSGTPADCTGLGDNYYNDPVSGHCYFRTSASSYNYDDAQAACVADGGYLATITSSTEQALIEANIPVNQVMWIGIRSPAEDGNWFYQYGEMANTQFWTGNSGGSPVGSNYNNWEATQPENIVEFCGTIDDYATGEWGDWPCTSTHRALCEISGSGGGSGGGVAGPTDYVAYWTLDETSGSTIADSAGSNTGAWNDSTNNTIGAEAITGQVNGGLDFNDADTAYITVEATAPTALDNLSPLSVCMWVNIDDVPGPQATLIGKTGGATYGNGGWALYANRVGGNVLGFYTGRRDWVDTAAAITYDSWQHICATWDGNDGVGGVTIYSNGVAASNGSSGLDAGTTDDSAYDIEMCRDSSSGTICDAAMDDVRIYDRVLTAQEVADIYNGVVGGGGSPSAPVLPDTFLIHPQVNMCTSAAPGPLVKVGESDNSNYYREINMTADYMFVTGYDSGIHAFRRNIDGSVTRLDTEGGGTVTGVHYDGTYVYAANMYGNLVAYTFDGAAFTQVGTINTPGLSIDVKGDDNYLYVADDEAIRAYTFNGTTFTLAGELAIPGDGATHVWTDGAFIYLSALGNGLYILTFNGTDFTEAARIDPPQHVGWSFGDGRYLYVHETWGVGIYEFDGAATTRVGEYDSTNMGSSVYSGFTDGKNLYFGLADSGTLVLARFNGAYVEVLNIVTAPSRVYSARSDGNLLYVGTDNGRMQVYSGVGCGGESSTPAGIANPAANAFDGKMALGEDHSCGIKPDGSAWCWGAGTDGHLGNGSTPASAVSPVRVMDSSGYRQITAGTSHSCGIRTDGTAWCWGSDTNGRLGNGAIAGDQSVPSPVSGGMRWNKLSSGATHTCGINSDADMYCWGNNANGKLGRGSTGGDFTTPQLVSGNIKWRDVTAGANASCGIDDKSQLWCWGNNTGGRLGTGELTPTSNVPLLVREAGPWVRVSVGEISSCGIKSDGSLWCWGVGTNCITGQPLLCSTTASTPVPVGDTGPWADVSVSRYGSTRSACAIKQDGTAWCWGYTTTGHLGYNVVSGDTKIPRQVTDPGPWSYIQTSLSHTCGIKQDGSAWCWGSDTNGRLGNGSVLAVNQPTPSRVVGWPNRAAWLWDETGRNISAAGSATTNIALGSTGVMGYTASGYVHNCAGLGDSHYNDPATGHCYYKVNAPDTWDHANDACKANGGYLAVITSNEEHTKILAAFGTSDKVWLGAKDDETEGEWRFMGGEYDRELFWLGGVDGTPQNGLYNNWHIGQEPNNDGGNNHCLSMYHSGFRWPLWDDSDCSTNLSYICEIGTAGAGGGLGFPAADNTLLRQYSGGSELLLETSMANTDAQVAWGITAGDSRAMGIDHTTGDLLLGLTNSAMTNWINTITPQMKVSTDGGVGIGVTGSVFTKLDVNGGLRIGADAGDCNVMREGTLRFIGGTTPFEYCNGSAWVPL